MGCSSQSKCAYGFTCGRLRSKWDVVGDVIVVRMPGWGERIKSKPEGFVNFAKDIICLQFVNF